MKKEEQTIRVKLHSGKIIPFKVPSNIDEVSIRFILNSKFGEQGWEGYKIRETKNQSYEEDTSRMGKASGLN